jgi:hypothetical protein
MVGSTVGAKAPQLLHDICAPRQYNITPRPADCLGTLATAADRAATTSMLPLTLRYERPYGSSTVANITAEDHWQGAVDNLQKKDSPVTDRIVDVHNARHGPVGSSESRYHRRKSKRRNDQPFRPLSASDGSIRLVKVSTNLDENGCIQCQMRHTTVESTYVGISYEWGDERTREIRLNGSRFQVRVNLYRFLECARVSHAGKWLWIDALCINQDNSREKERQVGNMGNIFSSARQVLSFIPRDSRPHLTWGAHRSPKDKTWEFLVRIDHDLSLLDRFVNHCSSASRDDNCEWRKKDIINGTIEFCQSTYWERLWIIQEVVWARELKIFDGIRSISWRTLRMVLQTIIHDVHTDENEKQQLVTSIPFRIDELRTGTRRTSLMALIADFGALKCKNFHDHVYGLRSLAIHGHHLRIEYNSSLLTLFFTTLRFCVRHGACLIEEAELFSCARTICKALDIDSNLLENASFSGGAVANITCNAVLSSFGTVVTTGVGSRTQPLLECRHCHLQTSRCPPQRRSTLFCLAAEGARVHLLSFSKATIVGPQKRKAALILIFPSDKNHSTSGERPEHIADAVTIVSSSPASSSPYHRLCLTPTGFLRILRYEHKNLEDVLSRSQQLCTMSDAGLNGGTFGCQSRGSRR